MLIIQLLTGLNIFLITYVNCVETYRLKISNVQVLICNMCRPGTFFIEDCTAVNLNAKCSACPDGTYEPYHNIASNCAQCTNACLNEREFIYHICTATSDTICRCKGGYYKQQVDGQLCFRHDPCPPGQGVSQQGDHETNTACALCDPGYFSTNTSATEICKKCTKCSPGFCPKHPCSATEDKCVKNVDLTSMSRKVTSFTSPLPEVSGDSFILVWGTIPFVVVILIIILVIIIFIVKHRRKERSSIRNMSDSEIQHEASKRQMKQYTVLPSNYEVDEKETAQELQVNNVELADKDDEISTSTNNLKNIKHETKQRQHETSEIQFTCQDEIANEDATAQEEDKVEENSIVSLHPVQTPIK